MTDYQKYINALRKCAKEHENDITSFGHIIVSDLCRDTANLLEKLEQENVLDKIRTEIEEYRDSLSWESKSIVEFGVINYILEQIIDKHIESGE